MQFVVWVETMIAGKSPPKIQSPIPTRIALEVRLRKMSHPNTTTQIGAVVAKKVAFATVVVTIERCQKKRPAANATPAQIVAGDIFGTSTSARSLVRTQAYKTGSARATRQKALVNGRQLQGYSVRVVPGSSWPISDSGIRAQLRPACASHPVQHGRETRIESRHASWRGRQPLEEYAAAR
jgi:hypothetical protein